jgi:hypothetical protein
LTEAIGCNFAANRQGGERQNVRNQTCLDVQFNRGADSAEGKSQTWRQAGLNHHRFGYAD